VYVVCFGPAPAMGDKEKFYLYGTVAYILTPSTLDNYLFRSTCPPCPPLSLFASLFSLYKGLF